MKQPLIIPKEYSLYEPSYGAELPFEQLYILMFNTIPSKFAPRTEYNENVIEHIINMGYTTLAISEKTKKSVNAFNKLLKITSSTGHSIFDNIISDERLLYNVDKKILIRITTKRDDNSIGTVIEFLYDISNGEYRNQFNFDNLIKFIKEKKKSNISLIKNEMGHFDIQEYDLNAPEMNLTLNYGEAFHKINDLIIQRLNKDFDKGIILLHGDPGTGKTSYIKYLTNKVIEKEILFIPPSMAESLSEPSFIPFLMDHKNSILIIEDAERVISDRENNGASMGVSNILNLTDGILGDCLGIQIIATFNMKKEKIDNALLRKGRLIVEHKFTALSVEETNKLLKHLKKDFVSEEKMCLADIYNIDVETYRMEEKNNKIGF